VDEMIGTKHRDDDQNPIRRLLRSLPQVEASEHFEARLRQRIAGKAEAPKRTSVWDGLIAPRRIPAYALSAAALVVVSVVAYYSLVSTGVGPTEETPVEQSVQQQQPAHPAVPPAVSTQTTAKKQPSPPGKSVAREQRAVSLPPGSGRSLDEPAHRREAEDVLLQHGLLKQVGQGTTPSRSFRVFDMPESVARFEGAGAPGGAEFDSAARKDSLKADSLRLHRQR